MTERRTPTLRFRHATGLALLTGLAAACAGDTGGHADLRVAGLVDAVQYTVGGEPVALCVAVGSGYDVDPVPGTMNPGDDIIAGVEAAGYTAVPAGSCTVPADYDSDMTSYDSYHFTPSGEPALLVWVHPLDPERPGWVAVGSQTDSEVYNHWECNAVQAGDMWTVERCVHVYPM